jgi:hypothetical protein
MQLAAGSTERNRQGVSTLLILIVFSRLPLTSCLPSGVSATVRRDSAPSECESWETPIPSRTVRPPAAQAWPRRTCGGNLAFRENRTPVGCKKRQLGQHRVVWKAKRLPLILSEAFRNGPLR